MNSNNDSRPRRKGGAAKALLHEGGLADVTEDGSRGRECILYREQIDRQKDKIT